MARGDGAFLVIEHNVSAALACTSGGFWRRQNIYNNQILQHHKAKKKLCNKQKKCTTSKDQAGIRPVKSMEHHQTLNILEECI